MTRDQEHARLLLPWDPPLPAAAGGKLPPLPALWERAHMLFDRLLAKVGSLAALAKRWRLSAAERRETLGWLEPIEKLVRSCLIVRAINLLLMTVEGRRLMRDTPKMAYPEKPRPPGAASDGYVVSIPHPGWRTIAAHHAALVAQERREQQRLAEQAARDRYDPASWRNGFRVVGWKSPVDHWTPPAKKPRAPWIVAIDPEGAWPPPPKSGAAETPEKQLPAFMLARRIHALARAMADPGRAAWRLARFLARVPLEALEGLTEISVWARSWWLHGAEEARHAAAHARRAASILLRKPEPG